MVNGNTWYEIEKEVISSISANSNFKRETGPLSRKLLENTIGSLCELSRPEMPRIAQLIEHCHDKPQVLGLTPSLDTFYSDEE